VFCRSGKEASGGQTEDNSIRFRYLPRIMHCFCINLLLNFITMKNLIANVLNEVTLKFYCSVLN
jgi:hypothetical protein